MLKTKKTLRAMKRLPLKSENPTNADIPGTVDTENDNKNADGKLLLKQFSSKMSFQTEAERHFGCMGSSVSIPLGAGAGDSCL
jgi:hypothetical protein